MLLMFGGGGRYNTRSITNAGAINEILSKASTRLIDIYGNYDSNGVFGGYGWDHGWQDAMLNRFGASSMYATGVHAFNEGGGGGYGVGYAATADASNIIRFRPGGANTKATSIPAAITDFWDETLDPDYATLPNHIQSAVWLGRANPSADQNKINGISIAVNGPMGLSGHEFQLWAAIFNSTSYPSAGTMTWSQVNGGNNQTFTAQQLTDAGATRVSRTPSYVQTLATQTTTYEIRKQSPAATLDTAYPVAGFFQRVVKQAATTGFSETVGFSVGSKTSTQCLAYWNAMGQTRLANHIAAVIYQQTVKGQPPYMLVDFCFGINDISAAISAATFKSNMLALIVLFRAAWAELSPAAGHKLRFCLRVTHPTMADDSNLSPYRVVCNELAAANYDTASVNMNSITSHTELNTATEPCYINAGVDNAHLKTTAYNDDTYSILMTRVVDEVV